MKLRLSPRAVRNLGEIADYLRERSPAAARDVRAAILASLGHLTRYPEAGRRQSVPGIRKLVTRKYAYLIYYSIRAEADEIAVLSIRHPSQQREHDDQ